MSNDPDADVCSECGSWRDLQWLGMSRICAACIAEMNCEAERRDECDMVALAINESKETTT